MSRFHIPLLAVLAALGACARAPSTTAEPRRWPAQPTGGAISTGDLRTRLYIIADDSMLGREAGQLGNFKATEYIGDEMRRMGLQPGGDDGTFFQTVPVTVSRLDTTTAVSVGGAPLVYGRDILPFHASAVGRVLPLGATTRSIAGVPVVYGGELGATLLAPAEAAGKLVVFTLPSVNGRRDYRTFTTANLSAYGAAAGIATVALDVATPAIQRRYRPPIVRVRADVTGEAPLAMLLSPAAAERVFGVSSLTGLTPGIAGRAISGSYRFTDGPAQFAARNVIGVLPGSDPALRGTYVALGAHNDHIGVERRPLVHDSVLANNMVVRRQGVQDTVRIPTADERVRIAALRDSIVRAQGGARADSINNGADDDASGTVALLEIAERFASSPNRPRRSMLFVSHTGEEKGLWGSQYFTDRPTVPRDSIIAQLNMDMVGRGKATDIMGRGPNNIQMIGPRRLATGLGALIDSVNAARPVRMDPDLSFDANGHPLNRYCRSDHFMYARYGIPITYFSLGYHTDYHQVTDEAQYIDYDHLQRIADFVFDIAAAIGNRAQRFVIDGPRQDPNAPCRQ